MRKTFTLLTSLALCLSTNAQELKILTLGLGTPGIDEPQLVGQSISPNGKYICGSIELGQGYFLCDLENDVIKFDVTEDPEGAELRHVDNNGLAIGYNGPGVTYSLDGVETVLSVPSDSYKYVLGEAISNDGAVMVGSLIEKNFNSIAAYSKDGGEWTPLPEASEEILGAYAGMGSAAKYVSGDGKVILGFVGSFGPAVLWVLNDKGEYEIDPLYTRYAILNEDDEKAGKKELYGLAPMNLSNNGKYALLQGVIIADDDSEVSVPAVYDVEAGTMTVYKEPQEIDEYGFGLLPTAISDNGTMIGLIGTQAMYNSYGSFIWKAGESKATTLSEAFPEYGETFGEADAIGYCVPMSMSADGSKIIGYGFYCSDYMDEEAPAYFATYIISDKNIATGIDIPAAAAGSAEIKEIYTIDGKRIEKMTKGINIIRMTDGSVRKILNK